MPTKPTTMTLKELQPAAGNGLFDRRAFFKGGAALAASMTGYTLSESAAAAKLANDPWSLKPGGLVPEYGVPSRFEKEAVVRTLVPRRSGVTGQARTPHHLLNGTVTPGGLHFVVTHGGVPDIDPEQHRLLIHGLVKQPLVFTLESLMRYPMETRMGFVECGGNSAPFFSPEPLEGTVQALHGMVSNSEWTGVMLSTLLEETGIDPQAKWCIAESAGSVAHTRSFTLDKALDDTMIALYQNGERVMPDNGYPMKLLLPGWEGNMNIKWLRRIELTHIAGYHHSEIGGYADRLPNHEIMHFNFIQEIKSFITHPSPGWMLNGPGFYEISGTAFSGRGRVAKVMVSADGGNSWARAALQEPVLPQAFTRFRLPWRWDGGPATLISRAWDESGSMQPTRAEILSWRGEYPRVPRITGFPSHHYNGPTSWGVEPNGEVTHVYA